jgi:hypothetical protein
MKRADNNEIELLLQSLGRRESERSSLREFSASVDEGRGVSDHLDADELNSYAEGVLPAAARARYTEHIADCGKCRGIVVGLMQSTGAANRTEVLDQPSGSGSWNRLAALFKPPVLRYAVPALVVTAVIAIGLVALRQQRMTEFVAQNQTASSSNPSGELKQVAEPRANDVVAPAQQQSSASPATTSSALAKSANEQKSRPDENSKLAQAPAAAPYDTATPAPAMKDSASAGQVSSEAEPASGFGRESPAPPPPAKRPVLTEADTVTRVSKEQVAEREAQERQREENRDQRDDKSGPNRSNSAKTAASPSSARRMGGIAGIRGGPSKDKKESVDQVETRMVSGRRFRREGSAWIDTAYESSQATINVARGSEYFRSLVADEPGIRAIAEQLAGEVIVVWKGRPYRIH